MGNTPNLKQRKIAELLADPVSWGESYLKNRNGARRKYWPHQVEDLRCPDDQVIHMDGRASGKSVNLIGHLLHYCFTTLGGSVLVAAPYQGHLEALIDEFDYQLDACPDLLASIAKNRRGDMKLTRKPYFNAEFTNGTVVHFRPAGVAGEAFRSLHVDRLYVDEGAWIPERGWKALRMCLNPGGKFRIYSTPNGLRNTFYYRLTQSKSWRLRNGYQEIYSGYFYCAEPPDAKFYLIGLDRFDFPDESKQWEEFRQRVEAVKENVDAGVENIKELFREMAEGML